MAYLCDIQSRKLAPGLTPPLSVISDDQLSEHVFAETLSATITCLHCGRENVLGFYRKQACVLEDTERFVIAEFTELDNQMQQRYSYRYVIHKRKALE